jgi:hypothetical protein
VALVATLVGALPCVLLIAVGGPVAVLGIIALVAWVITVQIVAAALTGILQMALYRFAVDGTVPGFDIDKLRGAFRPRRSQGGNGLFGGGGFNPN